MLNKAIAAFLALLAVTSLCACGTAEQSEKTTEGTSYMQISQEEAKKIMDEQPDCLILDVRTEDEFSQGHIPGAVLIPDYEIESRAEKEITDKGKLILVYCRSGRRSKIAAEQLALLGYTNVKEFGGIIDWQYETIADKT